MKNIKSFILGAITTAMLGALTVSALAVANVIEINTNVKIMVNGTAFAPKDKNGKDALVFIYDGTTYAPLRAIADAYGLDIGYDDNSRMVTVGKQGAIQKPETKPEITPEKWSDEDEKAYQEFKAMWVPQNEGFKGEMLSLSNNLYMQCGEENKSKLYQFCVSKDVETMKKISMRASREFVTTGEMAEKYRHSSVPSVHYRCGKIYVWRDEIDIYRHLYKLYELPPDYSYYKIECLEKLK